MSWTPPVINPLVGEGLAANSFHNQLIILLSHILKFSLYSHVGDAAPQPGALRPLSSCFV